MNRKQIDLFHDDVRKYTFKTAISNQYLSIDLAFLNTLPVEKIFPLLRDLPYKSKYHGLRERIFCSYIARIKERSLEDIAKDYDYCRYWLPEAVGAHGNLHGDNVLLDVILKRCGNDRDKLMEATIVFPLLSYIQTELEKVVQKNPVV